MNRSALFLTVGALLLASACAKQEAANPSPADTPPPVDSTTAPPAPDSTTPPADTTATPPPADSTTPPADTSTPPPQQ
jgi:hypothetical protein